MGTSPRNGNTLKSHMRTEVTDELIDTHTAAQLLGMSEASIKNYVRQGVLQKVEEGRGIQISMRSLLDAVPLLGRCFSFVSTVRTALQALVLATRAEKRLERVERLLGITSFVLNTDEESIRELCARCEALCPDAVEQFSAAEVLHWAYMLAAVTEEYLDLVALYTKSTEPWTCFMHAGDALITGASSEKITRRPDLNVAYGYVGAARQHLRQVAYFYIRNAHGAKTANAAFREVSLGKRDDAVISLLFADAKMG